MLVESDDDGTPEVRFLQDESGGVAVMSDGDLGRAAPRKKARISNLNATSDETLAMVQELQAVM